MDPLHCIFSVKWHVLPATADAYTLRSYQGESLIFDLQLNVVSYSHPDIPQRLESYDTRSCLRYVSTRVNHPLTLPEFPSQMRPDSSDGLP
jgi:hypothetical protein